MGISGLYRELGPPPRSSIARLAAAHYTTHSRPLRLAIDTPLWLFQIQAGKGGSNPALRTFYYRLLRLLTLNIHPLFVFDGPHKPLFKRNKKVGGPGVRVASVPEFLAKQLLKQFGFPLHVAPGEAEAECALLQREGVVDAVLSEDVDTLMFGSGVTFRNWSAETGVGGGKSGKAASSPPTHVDVYRAEETINRSGGLDREGMVLVALMSGGDYLPDGIPGCGIKLACDAARAGFGKDLCALDRADGVAMRAWKERLHHELRSNESRFFSRKTPSLFLPEDWPNLEVLGYYTHPCVSTPAKVLFLRQTLRWDMPIDFAALRSFTADAFDWRNRAGAKKFVKNLAPAMLLRELRRGGEGDESDKTASLVTAIHGKRNHVSTDSALEYCVRYQPLECVPIDLSLEHEDENNDFLPAGGITITVKAAAAAAVGAEEEAAEEEGEEQPEDGASDGETEANSTTAVDDINPETAAQRKKRSPRPFDPSLPQKVWLLHTWTQLGAPGIVEEYEASLRDPKTFLRTRRTAKGSGVANEGQAGGKRAGAKSGPGKAKGKNGKQDGVAVMENALTRFARVTKPGSREDECRAPKAPSLGPSAVAESRPQNQSPVQQPRSEDAGDQRKGLKELRTVPNSRVVPSDRPLPKEHQPQTAFEDGVMPSFKLPRTHLADEILQEGRPVDDLARPLAIFTDDDACNDINIVRPFARFGKTATSSAANANTVLASDGAGKSLPLAPSASAPTAQPTEGVPHTPGRRQTKRRSASSPPPPTSASTQRTITAYYSPSPRKALPPPLVFEGNEREVIDLSFSSSPVKSRLSGVQHAEMELPALPDSVTKRRPRPHQRPLKRYRTVAVDGGDEAPMMTGMGVGMDVSMPLVLSSSPARSTTPVSQWQHGEEDSGQYAIRSELPLRTQQDPEPELDCHPATNGRVPLQHSSPSPAISLGADTGIDRQVLHQSVSTAEYLSPGSLHQLPTRESGPSHHAPKILIEIVDGCSQDDDDDDDDAVLPSPASFLPFPRRSARKAASTTRVPPPPGSAKAKDKNQVQVSEAQVAPRHDPSTSSSSKDDIMRPPSRPWVLPPPSPSPSPVRSTHAIVEAEASSSSGAVFGAARSTTIASVADVKKSRVEKAKAKRLKSTKPGAVIQLRASLEGSWRELHSDDQAMSGVEGVDLTGRNVTHNAAAVVGGRAGRRADNDAHDELRMNGGKGKVRKGQRGWKRSGVEVVDMTLTD